MDAREERLRGLWIMKVLDVLLMVLLIVLIVGYVTIIITFKFSLGAAILLLMLFVSIFFLGVVLTAHVEDSYGLRIVVFDDPED